MIPRRDDIDGLRAVAILPIVLFHAGLSGLSGGFIGVDVFFVISGFLITSIIVADMDARRFSLMEFYKRRVVRIFPALFVMLTAVLVAACLLLLPTEVENVGESAAAAALFASNIYFFHTADYFAPAAETQPLLHTWSLGVEEQFYLLYPIVLLLVRRFFALAVKPILIGIVALSFAACLVPMFDRNGATFYLLPFRAWELGLGGLIALGAFPTIRSAQVASAMAMAGIGAILVGLLTITSASAFPGPWAILPAGGTVLLIAYGRSGPTSWLLSTPPTRWVGAISYSLYLWHWPIIAFYRVSTGVSLSVVESLLLIAASFAAGWVSYRFIEQPILGRFRRGAPGKPLALGAAALVAVCSGAIFVLVNAENWRDYPPDVRRVLSYTDYPKSAVYQYQFRIGECFFGPADTEQFDPAHCLRLSAEKPNVVVIGDSYAAHHWRAISLKFPELNVMQATAPGCRPVFPPVGARRCTVVMEYVLGKLARQGGLDWVILAGRWQEPELEGVANAIRVLQAEQIAVTVIGPIVEYQGEFPLLLARAMLQSDLDSLAELQRVGPKALHGRMGAMASGLGVDYLPAYDLECPGGRCALYDADGAPFHFDHGHFTMAASRQITANLRLPPGLAADGRTGTHIPEPQGGRPSS